MREPDWIKLSHIDIARIRCIDSSALMIWQSRFDNHHDFKVCYVDQRLRWITRQI